MTFDDMPPSYKINEAEGTRLKYKQDWIMRGKVYGTEGYAHSPAMIARAKA